MNPTPTANHCHLLRLELCMLLEELMQERWLPGLNRPTAEGPQVCLLRGTEERELANPRLWLGQCTLKQRREDRRQSVHLGATEPLGISIPLDLQVLPDL